MSVAAGTYNIADPVGFTGSKLSTSKMLLWLTSIGSFLNVAEITKF